jgi:hypothetical protein
MKTLFVFGIVDAKIRFVESKPCEVCVIKKGLIERRTEGNHASFISRSLAQP